MNCRSVYSGGRGTRDVGFGIRFLTVERFCTKLLSKDLGEICSSNIAIIGFFFIAAAHAPTVTDSSGSTTSTCAVSASGSTPRTLASRSWCEPVISAFYVYYEEKSLKAKLAPQSTRSYARHRQRTHTAIVFEILWDEDKWNREWCQFCPQIEDSLHSIIYSEVSAPWTLGTPAIHSFLISSQPYLPV